jgi:phosphate transport system substrate-binding protein
LFHDKRGLPDVNRSVLTRTAIAGVAVAALTLTGCSSTTSPNTNPTGTSTGPDYSSLSGTITGSGSSFQNALEQAAIAKFINIASQADVTYNSVGSGTGKKDFGAGTTDFGGTDSLVKAGDGPADGSYYYIPIASAPITVSYNLSGVSSLKLSADTIAKIFTRKITMWNDPAIAADGNTGLPSTAITVVHRSDGSGTTHNFANYLAAAAPSSFTLTPGDTVSWPTDTQGGSGNGGVAQIISQTAGAIGYVDFADATKAKLTFASVKNKDGNFQAPTLDGAVAAVAASTVADNLTYAPYGDVAGATVYPITSPTYVLLRPTYTDAAKGALVKAYFTWLLTDGKSLYPTVNFAFPPDSLVQKALAKIASVKAGA